MLIITHSQVRELLPMEDCMEAVGEALAGLARGDGAQPLRAELVLPNRQGVLAWMPGSLAGDRPFGIKILSVIDNAAAMGLDSHQGGVMIFDPETGSPVALAEAGAITAVRTAAVSALATDRLARPEATKLTILGCGTQAGSHIEAMLAVRDIDEVRIWGRDPAKVRAFVDEQAEKHDAVFEAGLDIDDAVAGADIICTTTSARKPILMADSMEPGMHINAVGASVPSWREIDSAILPLVSLITDRRESLQNEAGEYIEAVEKGLLASGLVIPELGEVLNGDHPGRTAETEITLFRSLGLAVEDVAAAQLVYERAVAAGVGTRVNLAR